MVVGQGLLHKRQLDPKAAAGVTWRGYGQTVRSVASGVGVQRGA